MENPNYLQPNMQQVQNLQEWRPKRPAAAIEQGNHHQQPQEQPPPPRACPRCNSANTKFCYFNNYSLSQPRYFCKSCRRYWTHGGTLRNIPVGGASRRNKRARNARRPASPPPQIQPAAPPQMVAPPVAVIQPSVPAGPAPMVMKDPRYFPYHGGVGGGGYYSSLMAAAQSSMNQRQGMNGYPGGSSNSNLGFPQGFGLGNFNFNPHNVPHWHQGLNGNAASQRPPVSGCPPVAPGSSGWKTGGGEGGA